jgi:imidazoleglycerol-phosphate dehydratase
MLRKTKETEVFVSVNLDGKGDYKIETGVPFFNHMLELWSRHSLVDLEIRASGDVQVDSHHTVEDVGIVLGQVVLEALGERKMINRYGHSLLPMDEALALAAIDLSNRACCVYDVNLPKQKVGEFDSEVIREFFQAFASNARLTLHLRSLSGENTHHVLESVFKASAVAFRQAVAVDERNREVPSTKDVL